MLQTIFIVTHESFRCISVLVQRGDRRKNDVISKQHNLLNGCHLTSDLYNERNTLPFDIFTTCFINQMSIWQHIQLSIYYFVYMEIVICMNCYCSMIVCSTSRSYSACLELNDVPLTSFNDVLAFGSSCCHWRRVDNTVEHFCHVISDLSSHGHGNRMRHRALHWPNFITWFEMRNKWYLTYLITYWKWI